MPKVKVNQPVLHEGKAVRGEVEVSDDVAADWKKRGLLDEGEQQQDAQSQPQPAAPAKRNKATEGAE